MPEEKKRRQKSKPDEELERNPGKIRGKLELPDLRERRDGPGGN